VTFRWEKDGAGWTCRFGDFTLYVVPERTQGPAWKPRAARESRWRAGVSLWVEATRTIERFGRDIYNETQADAKAARQLAEAVYKEAVAAR
jgi:hypothetical protein